MVIGAAAGAGVCGHIRSLCPYLAQRCYDLNNDKHRVQVLRAQAEGQRP